MRKERIDGECDHSFVHTFTRAGGRPPKNCPKCRKKRGTPIDPAAAQVRRLEREKQKRAVARGRPTGTPSQVAADLAAALSILPDAASAAAALGLSLSPAELAEAEAIARRDHAGVIEGDFGDLGRRIVAGVNLLVNDVLRERHQIAPRDKPHVVRALANTHAMLIGDKTPRVAQLTMMVVGADGKPFDPNAVPQPTTKTEG